MPPGQVVSQLRLLPRAMQAMILLGFILHFHMDLIWGFLDFYILLPYRDVWSHIFLGTIMIRTRIRS